MGCFNKIGFLSGLPIMSGDPTVSIFFVKSKYDKQYSNGGVVSSTDIFRPAFFPIFGDYDEYGKIENVIRDKNVELIEEHFGVDIDFLIAAVDDNMVGRNGNDEVTVKKNEELYKQLSYGLELKAVFDKILQGATTSFHAEHIGKYWLEKLGWQASDKPTKDERYKYLYTHPNIKNYVVHFDDAWSHLVNKKTGKQEFSTYRPNELHDAMHVLNVDYPVSEADKNQPYLELCWEISKREADKIAYTVEADDKTKEKAAGILGMIKSAVNENVKSWWESNPAFQGTDEQKISFITKQLINANRMIHGIDHEWLDGVDNFPQFFSQELSEMLQLTRDVMLTDDFKKHAVDFVIFHMAMSNLNAKYFPSNYGSQDQDFEKHRDLHLFYADLMDKKQKEYDDDNSWEEPAPEEAHIAEDLMDWIAAILMLTSAFLTGKKIAIGWLLGFFGGLVLMYIAYTRHLYGIVFMEIVWSFLTMYNFYKWKRQPK